MTKDTGERYFVGLSNYEPQQLIFPVNDGSVLRLRIMSDEMKVQRMMGKWTAAEDPIYSIRDFKYVMDVIRIGPGQSMPKAKHKKKKHKKKRRS